MLSRFAVGLLVLAAAVAAGCERVPLLAPSNSAITVSAPTTSLPAGGSTEITAFVMESGGTPVQNGTTVRFSATLGRVDPAEAETRGGVATTTFIAGSASGTAQIRAISGGATGSAGGEGAPASNVVEIRIGGAAATAVSATAIPSRVPSGGGTVVIVASVADASGNRLVGVPVTFSTTAGSLSSTSATTDASGEARVSLTTNVAANVVARAGNVASEPAAVSVGTAGTVALTVGPASPVTGSPVTLTINPADGTAPRVVVNWGDGSIDDLGIVAADRTATHVYQSPGAFTISATSTSDGESFSTSTPVNVGSGASVTLSAPTPATPTVGSPMTITVTPAAGSSPRVVMNWGDGTSTNLGVVTAARTVAHTYGAAGSYTVTATATAGNETVETSTAVTVSERPAVNVNVTSEPSGSAPRCQAVTFTATVTPTETINSYEWRIVGNNDQDETVTTTGNRLTRVFTQTGTWTVSVTATTSDGRRGNGQTQILVVQGTTSC